MNKHRPIVFYIILSLAGIGLLSWIVKDPGQLIKYLLMAVIVGTIIFFLARTLLRRRFGKQNDEMKKYRQAVKQSQKKYKQYNSQPKQIRQRKQAKSKRRRQTHLTLIKGNKSTKRNNDDRASN